MPTNTGHITFASSMQHANKYRPRNLRKFYGLERSALLEGPELMNQADQV